MEALTTPRRPKTGVARLARLGPPALVVSMVVGSLTLWVFSPFFWLWLCSQLQGGSTSPRMGPYGLMLLGIALTSVAVAMLLSRLQDAYARATKSDGTVKLHLAWLRMLGGEHEPKTRTTTVLDAVMVCSVLVAALFFVVWFLLVHPAPPGMQPGPAKH